MIFGTSPFTFHQFPSYHSSLYLPKLQTNFMRNFSCCGSILPSLHDLLLHYEETHAETQKSLYQNNITADEPVMQTIPDMDTVEDMEMDDVKEMEEKTPPPFLYTKGATQQSPHAQYNPVTQPRAPHLNMNTMQSQAGAGTSMYNNPSASCCTPTLTNNPMRQQFQNIQDQQYH